MISHASVNESNKIRKILMFMRHGEKLIKTGKKPKCGKFDSELSSLGINQSFNSGKKFLLELKKYNLPNISPSEIHIISSPYMRTLQTTTYFIKGIESQNFFNNDNNNLYNLYNVSIEYGIREILNKDKLKGEQIPKKFLNFLNNPNYKDFDEELKKLKLNIINDCEFSTEKESKDECIQRCKKYVEQQLINFDKDNKYKVIVIISHGGPIKYIMRRLGFNLENEQKISFCQQYYFDITEGIENAKFIKKVDNN